jgi:putative phosphoesterase
VVSSPGPVRVVVLSDTHLTTQPDGTFRRWLPAAAEPHLVAADVIIHAGDVLDAGVLRRLEGYAPVHAVLGNNDGGLIGTLPVELTVDVGGVEIAAVHDSGPRAGRPGRLRCRFPSAAVVVFGHSHEPVCEPGDGGQLLLNPGSPIQRRRQPAHTLGELVLVGGSVAEARIVRLD